MISYRGHRPACDCGQLTCPVEGVGRDALEYQAWACAYWPLARCGFWKINRKEGQTK